MTVEGAAGAHVTVELLETPDASFVVFGPERFVRNTGTPVTETRQFSLAATAAAPYRLCIMNGNPDGTQRISSASIILNGVEILTSSDLNQQVGSLMREVDLQPVNTAEVTLAATPSGFLDLCFTATDVTPPVITIDEPAPGLITSALEVTVAGAVQDETATDVTVNGQAADRTGDAYAALVPLTVEGENVITVSAIDGAGLRTDSTRTVIRDTEPPVPTVNAPEDGLVTNQTSVTVSGTVTDATAVTVNANGVPLPVDGAGVFSGIVALNEGANWRATVRLCATSRFSFRGASPRPATIRDEETAEIATHAALTGHLVLSTLHTNDAPSALTRLLDLDVAPYLVASTVEAVLAQRLVRVVCRHCREPLEPGAAFGDVIASADPPTRVYVGRGCDACRGTGFRGRTGVYELLVLDDEIREALQRGAGEIRRLAVQRGMRTLREDGLRLVREGITTVEEVLRVTRA